MSLPKFSVIIPTYNATSYIDKTLQFILSQHYDNMEVICLDDGSTDDTCAIIEAYAERYPAIRLIKHRVNQGPGTLRNKGIDEATGEWLLFCDSDDWYEEGLFNALAEVIVNHSEIDIIAFRFNLSTDQTKTAATWFDLGASEVKDVTVDNLMLATGLCNKCWRKSFVKKHQLMCCTINRSGEEIPFYMCGMLVAKRFYYLSKIGYNWRVNEHSLSRSKAKDESFLNGVWDMVEVLKNELKRLHIYEEEVYHLYVQTILGWHINEKFSFSKPYRSYYKRCRSYFKQHKLKPLPFFWRYAYKRLRKKRKH